MEHLKASKVCCESDLEVWCCDYVRKHTNLQISFQKVSELHDPLNSSFPLLLSSFISAFNAVQSKQSLCKETEWITQWMLLVIDSSFFPEELRKVQDESVVPPGTGLWVLEKARAKWNAIVLKFICRCGWDKKKENRNCASKSLYANTIPTLKKIISSQRLSINSQAGDACLNPCSHSWELQGHAVLTTDLASISVLA